jgi:predicted esterase
VTPRRLLIAALALAAIAVLLFLVFQPADVPHPPVSEEAVDADIEAWCAPALAPIPGGGCLALPARPSAKTTLIVYVHGRYAPKAWGEETIRQSRVAKLATSKGFAVLSLRGRQGECTQPELGDTWCWPSNPRNEADGPAFVKRFEPAISNARKVLGPGPNVLFGFSNGAYFATLIATRGLARFDAIAIAHGGPVPPTHAAGEKPPILLLTADDDPSDGEMRQLDDELSREKWPHEMVSREGTHELPDIDVNYALAFFDRALRERLPLTPPLQTPRPRKDAAPPPAKDEAPSASNGGEMNGGQIEEDDAGP